MKNYIYWFENLKFHTCQYPFYKRYINEKKMLTLDFYILICPIYMCIGESSRILDFTVKFTLFIAGMP